MSNVKQLWCNNSIHQKLSLSQAVLKHAALLVTQDNQHETVVETNVAHNEKWSNKVHLKQKTIDLTKKQNRF